VLYILGVAMIQQFSLKARLKRFVEKGKYATTKELQQQHDMKMYIPLDPSKLTAEQKKAALNSLMHLVETCNRRIKSRFCANGSKQRRMPSYKKEDAASPTVLNEGVVLTSAIDAHEGTDVAIIDVPGAFLHACPFTVKEIIMLLKGQVAETLVHVSPKLYHPFIMYDSRGGYSTSK